MLSSTLLPYTTLCRSVVGSSESAVGECCAGCRSEAALEGQTGKRGGTAKTKSVRRLPVPASGITCCGSRGAPAEGPAPASVQALALGDVARGAARLALHGGGGLALALLGRLLVVLALAGFGQHAGLLAGALEAAQGKLERLVFADFDAWHRNLCGFGGPARGENGNGGGRERR